MACAGINYENSVNYEKKTEGPGLGAACRSWLRGGDIARAVAGACSALVHFSGWCDRRMMGPDWMRDFLGGRVSGLATGGGGICLSGGGSVPQGGCGEGLQARERLLGWGLVGGGLGRGNAVAATD